MDPPGALRMEHCARFRTRRSALAAAAELIVAGFSVDGVRRRFRGADLAVRTPAADCHRAVLASSRRLARIIERHGGVCDGWGVLLGAATAEVSTAE